MVLFGKSRYAHRHLAHHCLTVQPAFSGDDQIRLLEQLFCSHLLHHQLDAWNKLCVQKGQKCKSHSSCRSCSWFLCIRLRIKLLCKLRIVVQPAVHPLDAFRSCSLLRTVNSAASVFSAQGIGYIAGNAEGTFFQLWQHMRIVDANKLLQSLRSWPNCISVPVQKVKSQRLQHSNAAVVGRAAADTDDEAAAALLNGIEDHLSHSAGGGIQWISAGRWNQRQSCRRRHLHHRRLFVRQYSIGAVDLFSQRSGDTELPIASVHPADQCIHRSFAAIRDRFDHNLCVRCRTLDSIFDRLTSLQRGHAPFKRIHYHCNFHIAPPVHIDFPSCKPLHSFTSSHCTKLAGVLQ